MVIKIQAPEEKQKLPPVYALLLFASILMLGVSLFFVAGYLLSR